VEYHVKSSVALVLLGAGGLLPCIRELNSEQPIVTFPRGESVYRISGSSTGRHLTYATRTGLVEFLETLDGRSFRMVQQLRHHDPVISACCDDRSFMFSDTEGGCYRCDGPDYRPIPLPREGKDPICALTVAGSEVVGVSTGGTIWIWGRINTESTLRLAGAPPPQHYAWVNAVYVYAWNKLIFPAMGGSLLAVSLSNRVVTTVSAHYGEIGATLEFNGRLLTVGRSDELACLWSDNPLSVEMEWKAPRNIVAIAPTHDKMAPLVAVRSSGDAFLCRITEDAITPVGEIMSGDFRCCFGFCEAAHRALRSFQRDHELRHILDTISEQRASGNLGACEDCLDRLLALGRDDIVLAVKADMAAADRNMRDEIHYRKALASHLPDDESSLCSLWSLAHVLVRLRLYSQARDVCVRIKRIDCSSQEVYAAVDRITLLASKVASGACVVSIGNVGDTVDAWDAASDTCDARILLNVFGKLDCHGLLVDVDEYLQEWELIQRESLCEAPATTRTGWIHIVEGWEIGTPIATVTHVLNSPDCPGLEISLWFREEAGQTLVEPALLFDPRGSGVRDNPTEHNRRIRTIVQEVMDRNRYEHWIARMLSLIEEAIQGVVSRKLSEARRKGSS
jgi:hypothetical protein